MSNKRQATTDNKDKGRFSFKCKTEAVWRLLRGEDLDTLSREYDVRATPAPPLTQ